MRVEDACAIAEVPLIWRPFLLGPIFAAQGWDTSPFTLYPAKGAYMWRDMERICTELGLPFQIPGTFPRGSLLAARVACAYSQEPWIGDFIRAVYHANFCNDRDIGDAHEVADMLRTVGQDPTPILSHAKTQETKDALRQNTDQAHAKGIFGAPSMIVDRELFWGHDRLDQAIAWAQRN